MWMMDEKELSFEAWQKTVHESIRSEKFWSLIAHQKALNLYNLLWNDSERWLMDPRGQILSKQITGSSDSICANIEEGLGRGLGKQLISSIFTPLVLPAKQKGGFTEQRHSTPQKPSTIDLILPARSLPSS
jgi:hypothetical protein